MKKKICIAIITVLALVMGASIYKICSRKVQDARQEEVYNSLSESVSQVVETQTPNVPVRPVITTSGLAALPQYAGVFEQNEDMVGWIYIEGTNINYPVMWTPDNPNFYVDHDFTKASSRYGCPYIQENCDVDKPSDNIVIYGHHMQDGSMFADLDSYKSPDFYEAHKIIRFDTIDRCQEYEIISVFTTVAYDEIGFRYYDFVDASDEESFMSYVTAVQAMSMYDTGIDVSYGDKLITLSTCEYSNKNGRVVIVAKLITE